VQGFFNALKNPWVMQFLGILGISLLIWFIGPVIAIAGVSPLAGELSRVLAIASLIVLWLVLRWVMESRARRKDREFTAALAQSDASTQVNPLESNEHVDLLKDKFSQALDLLRKGKRGLRADSQHLYELPWYIIIGPPGSGKSTALLNSGLRFPLAERFGQQPLGGVSGTRNCDWFFTDEAILIDTAGRYITQESHRVQDAAEWNGFLDLLKHYRPRRPINGVLVTVSVSDLLLEGESERRTHAQAVHNRIQELHEKLGIQFPIYLLLTKCDLLAGFYEYFGDYDEDHRAQVWGETFADASLTSAGKSVLGFALAFDELVQRLNNHTLKRIQEIRDIQRRSLVLDFPQQLALLKPSLIEFLEIAFSSSRYEIQPLLRGVYFTSGTQEGTPIDRVIGLLAASLRLSRQTTPIYTGQGKSFFLSRLLKEVIFSEAALAGVDPRVEKRNRLIQYAAYSGVFALGVLALLGWVVSYQQNSSFVDLARQHVENFRQARLDTSSIPSNLRTLVPKLDELLAASTMFETNAPLAHMGLYQGGKLEQAATHAYQHWLKSALLPLVARNLADRIGRTEASQQDILYELLKVYLMLGEPEHMDTKTAEPWILDDWKHTFAIEPRVLDGLAHHLHNLLLLRLDPVPLDRGLVDMARTRLLQVSPGIQIYTRFKNEALLEKSHDFNLGQALGSSASLVFIVRDQDIGAMTIPGLYTAWGYKNLFLAKSLSFVQDFTAGNWVLGQDTTLNPTEIRRLHRDLENLYLSEYQKVWMELLDNLRLRRVKDVQQTVEWLDILANESSSPLIKLLKSVKDNTSLTSLSIMGDEASGLSGLAPALGDKAKKALELAGKTSESERVLALEKAFKDYHALLGSGPDQPGGIDQTVKTLAVLRDNFLLQSHAAAPGLALKNAAAPGANTEAVQRAKGQLARLPEPLGGMLTGLASAGSSQTQGSMAGEARKELNALLKSEVTTPCKAAITGRFPLTAGGRADVAIMDFARLFSPNGTLDLFFQTHLKPFVDVTRPEWTEIILDRPSLGLSPSALRQFQYANRIRSAFFPAGGAGPALGFQLKPLSLDANVAKFRLVIEGQEVIYEHGPDQVFSLQWPGPNAGSGARMIFETPDGQQTSRAFEGPWALFRLLSSGAIRQAATPELLTVIFREGGYNATFELRANSVNNPFNLPELRLFSCPEAL